MIRHGVYAEHSNVRGSVKSIVSHVFVPITHNPQMEDTSCVNDHSNSTQNLLKAD